MAAKVPLKKAVYIYTHAECVDGTFAAYFAYKKLDSIGIRSCVYGALSDKLPPIPKENDLLFLDICRYRKGDFS